MEHGLKELDAGIAELKKRGYKLQLDQSFMQELSKLQVIKLLETTFYNYQHSICFPFLLMSYLFII